MTKQINRVLELGKIESAKVLLNEYFLKDDKSEWLKIQQSEYLEKYPTTRLMTDDEYKNAFTKIDGNEYSEHYPFFEDGTRMFPLKFIDIDYTNKEYLTFEEYLNETRILAPAEYYEGVLITPAIIEPIRTFVPITTSARIEDFLYPYLLEINKTNKENEIKNIQVTPSSGKTFYADPTSRADLSDAVSIMKEQNINEYMWKTVNGFELVTIDEMIEARALGLIEKGRIVGVKND